MTYTEFKTTYKNLFKYAPEVSNLYTDKPKKEITAVIKHFEKKGSRWIETESEEKKVDFIFYCNTVDPNAANFFRGLGGYEKTTKAYTKKGFIPVECISINPDRTEKTVRSFKF